jgi:hypothetical protein
MIIYAVHQRGMNLFAEFFLIRTNMGFKNPYTLPQGMTAVETIDFEGGKACKVERTFSGIEYLTQESLIKPIWILASDCELRGAFAPERVEGRRTFFGVPIDDESAKLLIRFEKFLKVCRPVAVYHGTPMNLEVEVTKGLKETYGMLGTGVYCGTFWKAARFACLGQDYKRRHGTVFRAIAFSYTIREYPVESWACKCERCKKFDWAAKFADHGSHWSDLGFDGAHASAASCSTGVCRDGTPKYPLRNEEWVFRPQDLVLTHFARINQNLQPPEYDPMFRDVVIY